MDLKKKILLYSNIILIVFTISLFWKYIEIPLNNTNEVVGLLTQKNINPLNDTLRYFIFISIPLIFLLAFNFSFNKDNLINISTLKKLSFNKNSNINFLEIKNIFLLLFLLVILELLSLDLTHLKLDTLHDGDFLTPGQNFLFYKQIWSKSHTVHGGSDIIYPIIAWKIFNIETIGAVRIFFIILILILKISSIFLALQMTKISQLDKNNKLILFSLLSLILISMSHYQLPMNYSLLSYRDLYMVLFLIFFIEIIINKNHKILLNCIISFLPFISILMHVDIGIYLYFIYFLFLFYLLINRNLKQIFINIFCSSSFWLIFYLLLGKIEFSSLFGHIASTIQNIDLIHGLEYPQPFFEIGVNKDSARATKSILIQLLAGIFVINSIIKKKSNYSYNQRVLLLFILILSLIMYKNALGRSDSYHIRMSTDLPIIIVAFFILEYLLSFSNKFVKNFYNNNKKINIFLIILIFIYALPNIKFKNLPYANKKFNHLLFAKDEVFIDKDVKKFINYINSEFKNEKCIFNFTEDLSISYLVKKPSCTKFFSPWLASGINLENQYIADLKYHEPQYIIYKSSKFTVDNISTAQRLKYVNKYILKNYKSYYKIKGYEIYKKI